MTAKHSRAVTSDGTQIAYRLLAEGRRQRVALLHSLAMDHSFWLPVIGRLANRADVLAIDCRGHGGSGKPAGPYRVERFADDLAQVLDVIRWPSAVVAGASMGGCISLAFAARHPGRVDGLGLIDTTAWYGEDAPRVWEERGQKAVQGGMAALIEFQRTRWLSPQFREQHPAVLDRLLEVFLDNDVEAYRESCRMLGACDLRPALSDFRFPVRIMVGAEDYATPPAMAEALRDAIPGASLRVIEGVRHFSPVEAPQVIAAEIAALLPP